MKLIVGLGNPGREYEQTRHNIGFMAINEIARFLKVEFNKEKFQGSYAEAIYNSEKIILLKPGKYMNLSGEVIRDFISYFKIDLEDILIIYDDLDTSVGMYRLRYQGGNGGHNGIKDIEKHIGTKNYNRIKIGISNDKNYETRDYVLGKFSSEEQEEINKIMEDIVLIFKDYFNLTFDNLMNKYNSK
jgi:peptidyl-tRNA hydrolase